MQKKTKDQKYYRKLKEDGQKDFRKVERDNSTYPGIRVTKKQITFRVSQEAADRLKALADQAEVTQWEMVSRIILKGFPGIVEAGWAKHSDWPTRRYEWDWSLIYGTDAKVKYKGSTGDKQLNMRITSTAWNKIHCARTALGKSMSRLMQDLLLHYKPLTPEQLAKQREYQQQRAATNYGVGVQSPKDPDYKPKSNKFLDVGDRIIHVKEIPIETWDPEEYEEWEQLMLEKYEGQLARAVEEGNSDKADHLQGLVKQMRESILD